MKYITDPKSIQQKLYKSANISRSTISKYSKLLLQMETQHTLKHTNQRTTHTKHGTQTEDSFSLSDKKINTIRRRFNSAAKV